MSKGSIMYKLKKAIAIMLAVLLTFGLFPALTPPASAAVYYNDVNGHWADDVIDRWNAQGALVDSSGAAFRPNAYITRAEFFAILVRALGATTPTDVSRFSDLDPDAWYYGIVAIACNMGIANGDTNGTMRPNDNLLRQDAVTLMARALGMVSENIWGLSSFSDHGDISEYAKTYIAAFMERKTAEDKPMLSGYPDGTLKPRANLTRAEAVKMLDNLFPNIYQTEPTLNNVFLTGGLLVATPDAELNDLVLYGDVVIGDGVGSGDALLSNCTIVGRLIVRGGGPNSVTVSNTTITDGIYVASFGADTRLAVTDDSIVDRVEAVSGFTLSGRGVKNLTILDQAREGAIINLNGVNLDELNIGGRGAKVNLISGVVVNARIDGAGQNAQFDLAEGTSVTNATIAAPNVSITGKGIIRSLLINNTGAVIENKPEFTTVGVNLTAIIVGEVVSGPQAGTPNQVNRTNNSSLAVKILDSSSSSTSNYARSQRALTLSMAEGRSATEVYITQEAAAQIPLSEQVNARFAYWIGFFIPEPNRDISYNRVTLTYTYADGEPVTFRHEGGSTSYESQRGLRVYLPVFREPGTWRGQLKETLYINWGDGVTENLQFASTALSLATLTSAETKELQADFDAGNFYGISGMSVHHYSGAEGIRRILSADNPLGLPSGTNKGLSALNRALTVEEVKAILEERQLAADLTVDTSGNSPYGRLSDVGKTVVAESVLNGRKASYLTPSAVKAIFDKAVNDRLAKESALLVQINGSGDYAALRKIIENAANAAILDFKTGADPYKSFSNAQKDAMADYLFKKKPYRNIQEVIDAIKNYLGDPETNVPSPDGVDIKSITANPTATPNGYATGAKFTSQLRVTLGTGVLMNAEQVGKLTLDMSWQSTGSIDNANRIADIVRKNDTLTFTALRPGTDTLRVLHTESGKACTIKVTVAVPKKATAMRFSPNDITLMFEETRNLRYTALQLTPADASEPFRWSSDNPVIATVDSDGVVTAGTQRGMATITALGTESGLEATCEIWVFENEFDLIVWPTLLQLQAGAYFDGCQVRTATPLGNNRRLEWSSSNGRIVTVSQLSSLTARIMAAENPASPSAIVTVSLINQNDPDRKPLNPTPAEIEVKVQKEIGIEFEVREAVMYNGADAQRVNILRDNTISPAFPGEMFYWESSNPVVKLQRTPGGTASRDLMAPSSDAPLVVADGIGESLITLRLGGKDGPVMDTKWVITVPLGVMDMKFYEGTALFDDGPYGRVVTIERGGPAKNLRVEDGMVTPTRNMQWDVLASDADRNVLSGRSGSRFAAVSYSQNRGTLTAGEDMGLAALKVTPSVSNVPSAYLDRWWGRDSALMCYFEEVPTAGGIEYEFNTKINVELSRLHVENVTITTGGAVSTWTRLTDLNKDDITVLDRAKMKAGEQFICDANKRRLVRGADWDYTISPLVMNVAAVDGSNYLYVWVKPALPTIELLNPLETNQTIQYSNLPQGGVKVTFQIIPGGSLAPKGASGPGFTYDPNHATTETISARVLLDDVNYGDATLDTSYGDMVLTITIPHDRFTAEGGKVNVRVSLRQYGNSGFNHKTLGDPDLTDIDRGLGGKNINNFQTVYSLTVVKDDVPVPDYRIRLGDKMPATDLPGVRAKIFDMGFANLSDATIISSDNSIINIAGGVATALKVSGGCTINIAEMSGVNIVRMESITIKVDPRLKGSVTFNSTAAAINFATAIPEISQACALPVGITDLAAATYTADPIGLLQFGLTGGAAYLDPSYVGQGDLLTITIKNASGDRSAQVDVNVIIPPTIFSVGTSMFSVDSNALMIGISMLSIDLPGVQEAARGAGIDLDTAKITTADPSMLAISSQGTATPLKEGKVKVNILSKDGKKNTTVTVEIKYSGNSAPPPAPPMQPTGPTQPPAQPPTGPAESTPPAIEQQQPVKPPTVVPTTLKLRPAATVALGGTPQILRPYFDNPNVDPATLVWTSSNVGVAKVDNNGVVTGIKAGVSTITLTVTGTQLKATCRVTVAPAGSVGAQSITLNKAELSLAVGQISTLTVIKYLPTNAKGRGVTWQSSNEAVMRVSPTGAVTGISIGTAKVTAICDITGVKAECVVAVVVPVTGVTQNVKTLSMKPGETALLTYVINPENATNRNVTWKSSNPRAVIVDEKGNITALAVGTATITVTTLDGNKSDTCRVTVKK